MKYKALKNLSFEGKYIAEGAEFESVKEIDSKLVQLIEEIKELETDGLSFTQLKTLAKNKGIEFSNKNNKKELIELINA